MPLTTVSIDSNGLWPRERRCVVFSSRLSSTHRFVRVETSDQRVAYAQLRDYGSTHDIDDAKDVDDDDDVRVVISSGLAQQLFVDGEDAATRGVPLALKFPDPSAVQELDQVDAGARASCECAMGRALAVQVQLVSSAPRSSEYLQAIETCARQLLDGEIVWKERRMVVQWSGASDTLVFTSIQVSQPGTGCCHALAKLSKQTLYQLVSSDTSSGSRCTLNEHRLDRVGRAVQQRVGGYHKQLDQLLQAIGIRFAWTKELQGGAGSSSGSFGNSVVGGLLSGISGVGKTFMARVVAESLDGVFTRFLHGPDIFQVFVGHSEEKLIGIFKELEQNEPSLLVIDEIECIAVNQRVASDEHVDPLQLSLLSTFLACLNDLQSHHKRVFVLGTTSHLESVGNSVLCNGRLDLVLSMDLPDAEERLEILERITAQWTMTSKCILKRVADSTAGYVGADVVRLCQEAVRLSSGNDQVEWCHFAAALTFCSPSVLQNHQPKQPTPHQEEDVTATSSEVPAGSRLFDSIFGLDDVISTLRVSLLDPLADCSRFLHFGAAPPKGILLVGPSGSGKSLLAQAVAEEVRRQKLASFVSVRCTDLLTKVVGDTEKALRAVFQTARNAAPCVLFFDQIETLAPCRGFDTTTEQTFDRLLSMLLVEMDGFKSGPGLSEDSSTTKDQLQARKNAFLQQHVVILASTTEKKLLDPAILRPGRFDVHLNLRFPDEEARKQIILNLLDRVPVAYDPSHTWGFSKESTAVWLAQQTPGLAANRLESFFREAAMASLRENLEATTLSISQLAQAIATP